jgi:hypothetical protein
LAADADLVNEEHVRAAGACSNWEWLRENWGMSSWDTVATVKGIALDAVAGSSLSIVSGVGLAASTFAVDVLESRIADAGDCVNIENFIGSAGRSADGQLSIIVVGGSTVSTDSLDQVESIKTHANVV